MIVDFIITIIDWGFCISLISLFSFIDGFVSVEIESCK